MALRLPQQGLARSSPDDQHILGAVWLLKGDRLKPSVALVDVFAFDRISIFPARLLFWRSFAQTVSLHSSA